MIYKKKKVNIIIIHKNKDKNLKKKYIKILKNKFFILNKNVFLWTNLLFFFFNKLLKKEIKIFKIINLLIWKSSHSESLKKTLIILLKINKNIKIEFIKNIGNHKKIKKNIKKLV